MIGLLLDSNYELFIGADGLQLGEITPQNQALIIQCHRGELKELPALGVGISDMTLDHDPLYWRRLIREALDLDGQRVEEIKVTTTGISIKAVY